MASRAISGKPGGGKSYLATKWLLDDLLNTDFPIVTNIPLDFDGIAKFCSEKGRSDIDLGTRIVVLPDSEVREFWRYRGNGLILPEISDYQIKEGIRPSPDSFGLGVRYYLDEIHKFLNSREWKSTGPLLLWYISQHRHFGDEVVWITQHVGNVDKQWKSVTQDYTYVNNFSKEKFRGFTKGNKFRRQTYLEPFTGSQTLQESEEFSPDWNGIGSCYRTSIASGAADKGQSAKGFSVRWLFAGIIFVVCLVAAFFMWGPNWIAGKVGAHVDKLQSEKKDGWKLPVISPAPRARTVDVSEGAALPKEKKKEPPVILAVLLKSMTGDEVIQSMKENGSSLPPDVQLYPSPFGCGVVVLAPDLPTAVSISETIKIIDSEKVSTIVVQAVVLRKTKGKSSTVGVWESLQAVIAQNGFGSSSIHFDPVAGIVTLGNITFAQEAIRILGTQTVRRYGFTVESRPSLSMTSGRQAWFASGQEVPVPVTTQNTIGNQNSITYKKVQFSLGVTATKLINGRIVLDVIQANDDVIGSATVSGNSIPTIATQSLSTRLELSPGQLAILGGIEILNGADDSRAFPVLGAVPPLSWIFGTRDKTHEKSELVVAITAFIVPVGQAPALRSDVPVLRGSDAVGSVRVRKAKPVDVRRALPL